MRTTPGVRRSRVSRSWLVSSLIAAGGPIGIASAESLRVTVEDGTTALADAVVSLHALVPTPVVASNAVLDQRDSQFAPRVLAVPMGSQIAFPNSDNVRHHVYSFSPAKRFELPLYSGSPAAPVTFETAGIVTMGCNIHDWMIAHVIVLDTPYFAKSDAQGQVTLDAPPGDYTLRTWHERLPATAPVTEQAITLPMASGELRVSLALAPPPPPPTQSLDPRLRALQEKARSLKRER